MLRSLGILLVALSLLAGPASLLPQAVECARCADHCPMKKPRLPCHSQEGSHLLHLPCHSGPRFASSGCSHDATVAPLSREFVLLTPQSAPRAADFGNRLSRFTTEAPEAPVLEPPIDPPRSWFAV